MLLNILNQLGVLIDWYLTSANKSCDFLINIFLIWRKTTTGCKFYCSKFFSFSWFLLLIFINLQWTIDTSTIIYLLSSFYYERMFVMKVESFVFFYIVFFVCMFCVNIIIIKNLKNLLAFRVLGSKFFKLFMSILKQQVSSSSKFASFFNVKKDSSSVTF